MIFINQIFETLFRWILDIGSNRRFFQVFDLVDVESNFVDALNDFGIKKLQKIFGVDVDDDVRSPRQLFWTVFQLEIQKANKIFKIYILVTLIK